MSNALVKADWGVTLEGKPVSDKLTASHFISREMRSNAEDLAIDAEAMRPESKAARTECNVAPVYSAESHTRGGVSNLS